MTVSVERTHPRDKKLRVHFNYGPIHADIVEDPAHLRGFWSQLGHLLDVLEHEDDDRP